MTYEQFKNLKPSPFKRRCRINSQTFEQMVELLCPHLARQDKRGGQAKLTVEDQLLLVLEYWREYRTQFHIATNLGRSANLLFVGSESRKAVNGFWGIPLTRQKTACSKCLQLR